MFLIGFYSISAATNQTMPETPGREQRNENGLDPESEPGNPESAGFTDHHQRWPFSNLVDEHILM